MEIYALQESYARAYLEAIENASVEERTAAVTVYGRQAPPDIFSISEDGSEAYINISGVLSQEGPSPIAKFFGFGGTGYKHIIEAAQLIGEDNNIKTVKLRMNTPGGSVNGMDQARQAIKSLTKDKTVIAENHGLIASAGYYLASAANKIEAISPLAQTGSIGVVIAGLDYSKAMENVGVKQIKIVSRNAPDKQPDPNTKHGESVLQAEADAMERVFIQKVAEGRGTTTEDVIQNFGKGGLLIAQDPDPNTPDATKVGMIDGLSGNAGAVDGEDFIGIDAGPTQFKDFPIEDRTWDSAAAIQRVRNFVGATDAPNERYRQAFFWYDANNSENFGAYKLPFVDIVNGRMVAIWKGVTSADGAMSGARGQRVQIPAADRPRVQAHIDRYKEKWANQQKGGNANGGGNPVTAVNSAQKKESRTMDLNQLKQEHPAVFAEAVALGETKERDRVTAHITMGNASGDMDFAVKCIEDGTELTASVQAKHLAAGLNRNDKGNRATEGSEAAAAISGAGGDAKAAANELSEAAIAMIEEATGVTNG